MKILYPLLAALLLNLFSSNAQAQLFNWAVAFGDSSYNSSNKLVVDSQNNLLVTGAIATTVGGVSQQSSLVKYSSTGSLIWAIPYVNLPYTIDIDVAVDGADNIYISADYQDSAVVGGTTFYTAGPATYGSYIAKFNSLGTLLWAQNVEGVIYQDLDSDASGNVFVTGRIVANSVNFGPINISLTGAYNSFLAKLSVAGTWEWAQTVNSSNNGTPKLKATTNGDVLFAFPFTDTLSFGSTVFPAQELSCMVSRFNSAGNLLWAQQNNTTDSDYTAAITTDFAGNCYLGINHGELVQNPVPGQASVKAGFHKYSPTGNLLWSAFGEGADQTICTALATDAQGNLYATGWFFPGWISSGGNLNTNFGSHAVYGTGYGAVYVAKYTTQGEADWATSATATNYIYSTGLAVGANNMGYLTGVFVGYTSTATATFGAISIQSNGNEDGFISSFLLEANTITGRAFFDANSNGLRDAGELGAENLVLQLQPDATLHSTNLGGAYTIYSNVGSYAVSVPNVPLYYTLTPATQNASFGTIGLTDSANHFALQPIAGMQDLEITTTAIAPQRPGFAYPIQVTYKNIGTTVLNGSVEASLDPQLILTATTPTFVSQTATTLTWSFSNLQPQETQIILIETTVPTTTPLDTVIVNSFTANPLAGDLTPANNTKTDSAVVVGSFDPNDKQVSQNHLTPTEVSEGKYLEYTIRFQNTGTDTAFTVRLLDTLDAQLNIPTFEMLASSHNYTWNIRANGILEWRFDNILLPDSTTNEAASHGFVKYRVRPNTNLTLGSIIRNTAAIYFDFNAPVITNTATTEVALVSAVADAHKPQIQVYPNPNKGSFTVELQNVQEQTVKAEIRNVLGQTVWQQNLVSENGNVQQQIKTHNLSKGVYHLQVSTSKGNAVQKVVIE